MKVLQVAVFIGTGCLLIWADAPGGYGLALACFIVTYVSTVVIPESISDLIAKQRRKRSTR